MNKIYLGNISRRIDCKCRPCTNPTVIAFLCIPICTLNRRNSWSSAPPAGIDADQRPQGHCQLFFFWFCFVCSSSQTIQLFWVSIIIYWTRDLFYLLTQFGNHALVAASPTWLDAFWSRYVVQVDNVTFFFVMSLTTSQNITRALNCDSGIVATVASVQRSHVTRIVVGYNVSYFS